MLHAARRSPLPRTGCGLCIQSLEYAAPTLNPADDQSVLACSAVSLFHPIVGPSTVPVHDERVTSEFPFIAGPRAPAAPPLPSEVAEAEPENVPAAPLAFPAPPLPPAASRLPAGVVTPPVPPLPWVEVVPSVP